MRQEMTDRQPKQIENTTIINHNQELQENVMPMTWMFNVSFLFNNQ